MDEEIYNLPMHISYILAFYALWTIFILILFACDLIRYTLVYAILIWFTKFAPTARGREFTTRN